MKQVSVMIDHELSKRLGMYCKSEGLIMKRLVSKLIEEYLESKEEYCDCGGEKHLINGICADCR